MKLEQMKTPAIVLDMDILERNIKRYQETCTEHGKQLWPMLKTHKSLTIARMQAQAGAAGFLCGTLDECEAMCEAGYRNLMYAYPVASKVSIDRVIELSRRCNFCIRLDTEEAARLVNEDAKAAGVTVNYTIIVDSGLHRFGVTPDRVAELARKLQQFEFLSLKGISTHPGAVYAAENWEQVLGYAKAEAESMNAAADALRREGFVVELVTSGSTPTFMPAVSAPGIGVYHPGNYVFHDTIQIGNGSAAEEDCALTVLATVISHPQEGLFLMDAGAKCLGLDQGAHGNSAIVGFGRVVGHPELIVSGLSEEVGKLKVKEGMSTGLKVGDQIQIIPNHSCSTANLTDRYVAVRGGEVVGTIPVDVRSNRGEEL